MSLECPSSFAAKVKSRFLEKQAIVVVLKSRCRLARAVVFQLLVGPDMTRWLCLLGSTGN